MKELLFDSWPSLGRTVIIGIFGYLGLILLLRMTGKRTLSKLNMFDFIVTVAFGSVLAGMMMSKTSTLAQGLVAFGVLVIMQYLFTFLSVRWPLFDRVIKAEPRLLFFDGKFLDTALKEERVARSELHAATREAGIGDICLIHSIVLETNGVLTVIPKAQAGEDTSLPDPRQP